ncbi:dTDP-D-glucose 4,6-dehydratase [Candidatus Scalindua japonica]|uniref:dTDP-D-glucose 4,6-dehydratase n=1 Tax=Candidatus Scalindua japonica TaxID=1284222 RepID=A0A286U4H7_9BACT|nr:GDP-mannose 4,6-dehydratase [Candidatus Scalindua japonica]GAX63004.1 dTDP-D-glucose 4,6-dehydratase [Candidatus Scalindua japonica]
MMSKKVVAVTGCLGFIGSHFTRACLHRGWNVWGIDKITYAAHEHCLQEFKRSDLFKFTQADICTMTHLYDIDVVVNFAAETHVDNSIMDARHFVQTNVCGVENLLELIRSKRNYEMPLLVHISTDEVYGDIAEGLHSETDILTPSNPYSASKAAADLLILGWHRTHDIPYNIIRPTNNYGLDQYPEKLIPKAVKYLTLGKPIPVHGDGSCRRNWLHAQDTTQGIMTVIDKGECNTVYNLSGNCELPNKEVIQKIINYYFGEEPSDPEKYTKTNYVRIGEDIRYSLDDSKLRKLGFKPEQDFDEQLKALVKYYKDHFIW